MQKAPIISIIIPCFNSGKYLPDALSSIEACKDVDKIETIIVDDGSTEEDTLQLLQSLGGQRYTIIHQQNHGPAAARNAGVQAAKADFLLFLDSDNKIRPEYIEKGIEVLAREPDVAVVYGNAAFFGDTSKARFKSKPFDIFTLLMGNYIDVCSVVRKKALEDVNGFDESRILFGHEDWELWIRLHDKKWKFHYIDETLFDYRVRANSLLVEKSNSENIQAVLQFVYRKHLDLFIQHQERLLYYYKAAERDRDNPFRTFCKNLYRKYLSKIDHS